MRIQDLTEDLQFISDAYAKEYNIDRTSDWHIMKLTEELGELMQSYLKLNGQARTNNKSPEDLRRDFEDEVADVIGMVLLLARDQKVNLEEAISRKWLKYHESPRSLGKSSD